MSKSQAAGPPVFSVLHRFAGFLNAFVVSPGSTGQSFLLSRWLFLRLLGVVYLAAFASLGAQVRGLIGSDGILPAGDLLPIHFVLRVKRVQAEQ